MLNRNIHTILSDQELIEWEAKRVIRSILDELEKTSYVNFPEKVKNRIRKKVLDEVNASLRLYMNLLNNNHD